MAASGLELINQAVACHLTSAGAWASHTGINGIIFQPVV